jgi:hypothetical protein
MHALNSRLLPALLLLAASPALAVPPEGPATVVGKEFSTLPDLDAAGAAKPTQTLL